MSHVRKFDTKLPAEGGAGDIEIVPACIEKFKEMKKERKYAYLIFRMVGQVCVPASVVEYLIGEPPSTLCTCALSLRRVNT